MSERTRDTVSRVASIALMIAILFIAAGVSAITAMRWAIQGKEVTVPDLSGKSEAEAAEILAGNNLVLRSFGKRYSQVPTGRIVEQIPPAGSKLKSARSVKVRVSAGSQIYAVPNLVGLSLRAAKLTLEQRNYNLNYTSMVRTPSGEPLTVQQQDPQPGTQGTDPAVNVLVASGRVEESFVMPDVINKRLEQVARSVRAEGFQLSKVTYRRSPGVEAGLVIQQQPQSGHRMLKSDSIILEVSQ